ncbi:MAG: hypothetical protein HOU01_13105 [Streptomycetaceae bacterium]|jgi:hypothetical protein|nr:hypothetical protein [Streptomycetaceae bacterium]
MATGVTPGSQTRGLVICTLVYLAIASLYSALYEPAPWMWFGWSVMAIVSAVFLVTERD